MVFNICMKHLREVIGKRSVFSRLKTGDSHFIFSVDSNETVGYPEQGVEINNRMTARKLKHFPEKTDVILNSLAIDTTPCQ